MTEHFTPYVVIFQPRNRLNGGLIDFFSFFQFDFDSFVYPFDPTCIRRMFREVLFQFSRAESALIRFNARFHDVGFTDIPFYFPIPQVQVHMLVLVSDYGHKYIAEERMKYIFDFFLGKNMYIFGADAFDFLPVIHHHNPIMYVRDFIIFPVIKMHVPT